MDFPSLEMDGASLEIARLGEQGWHESLQLCNLEGYLRGIAALERSSSSKMQTNIYDNANEDTHISEI